MNYAKENEVKAGIALIADGSFTCIREDAVLTIKEDNGGLFVDCDDDGHKHYLDGQIYDGEVYIGFRLATNLNELQTLVGERQRTHGLQEIAFTPGSDREISLEDAAGIALKLLAGYPSGEDASEQ